MSSTPNGCCRVGPASYCVGYLCVVVFPEVADNDRSDPQKQRKPPDRDDRKGLVEEPAEDDPGLAFVSPEDRARRLRGRRLR